MRPRDPRYNAIPLDAPSNIDASIAYVACRLPITDRYARGSRLRVPESLYVRG